MRTSTAAPRRRTSTSASTASAGRRTAAAAPRRIAIDTGGTFTDCVYLERGELRVLKLFSTPADPGQAIRQAVGQIAPGASDLEIRHGTTVGTNTLLEGKGARVAFVTTAGFEDTIAIGRQARPALYTWAFAPRTELAPAERRFGVAERVLADGSVLEALTPEALAGLAERVGAAQPEAVAVSLLFAFAHPAHEAAVGRALARLGVPISLSSEILPEFREFERGMTVLINAYLSPRMSHYLGRLGAALAGSNLHVMQSSGGIVSAAVAASQPVRTILSGPAGGVVGAHAVARQSGYGKVLTFDMGGTSTDVALVEGHGAEALRTSNEGQVIGLPVGVPMLDIHTVGAGGGSLARFDAGGALQVGPESAGADPGPACYGKGERPTVTDANLVLGRLDPAGFLGGGFRLDAARARRVLEASRGPLASPEIFADGIVRLAEATMEKALRLISLERGFDPREFTLVSFGGAGPLHAAALARALQVPRVLVPPLPGALSALGILMSDMVKDYSRTVMLRLAPGDNGKGGWRAACESGFAALETHGAAAMRAEGLTATPRRSVDLRYHGQGYELNVVWGPNFLERFHRAHAQRYGFADPRRAIEIVNLRVRMVSASPPLRLPKRALKKGNGSAARLERRPVYFDGGWHATPIYAREKLQPGDGFAGPAVVTEYSATTVLPPGCRLRVDAWSNLILEVR